MTLRPDLPGERKHVTVLFADVTASMAVLTSHDAEEAAALFDRVIEHMVEAVRRYEGTVMQVLGDGIFALFGALTDSMVEGAIAMARLSLGQAMKIVETALAKGRTMGLAPLAVAVLDDGGHLKAFAREDGAGIMRPQIATGKAWGALGMGFGSRTFARRAAENPAFFSALYAASDGRLLPAAGGVLIKDSAGEIVGAVGISGDTSDKDEACALAGITAAGLVGDPGA